MLVGTEDAVVIAVGRLDWFGGGKERWEDLVMEDEGREDVG